jgi:hypothetical protein
MKKILLYAMKLKKAFQKRNFQNPLFSMQLKPYAVCIELKLAITKDG